MKKTDDEIEALIKNWEKDPCWDIENTEGFEEYHDDLRTYRMLYEGEQERKSIARKATQAQMFTQQTGITGKLAEILFSFGDIEHIVGRLDGYINSERTEAISAVRAELMQAQVRATLLLAAQVKRVADALESNIKPWAGEEEIEKRFMEQRAG